MDRLKAYEPFLKPLAELYAEGRAVDLGCGRGEWLELLRSWRFQAVGVDLDDAMLADCRSRQLQVVTADAIDYLRTLPDASHCLVSGFHLVEHIPFDRLRELVAEAFRILRPGGLLILETPNAENLRVGSSFFYMDPSHLRPIPALLLAFVAEVSGFKKTKVLGLNGEPVPEPDNISIFDVLDGVSPDCSIVAQKAAGTPEAAELFDAAFRGDRGVSLQQLATAYEEATRRRVQGTQERIQKDVQEREDKLRAQLQVTFNGYEEQAQRTGGELLRLQAEADQMRIELNNLHRALHDLQSREAARWTTRIRRKGGSALRRAVPLARSIAHRTTWAKGLARAILKSSPVLARFVGRFLNLDPAQQPAPPAPAPIRLFQDLRSVKLMSAIARTEQQGSSVIFIGKDEHGT